MCVEGMLLGRHVGPGGFAGVAFLAGTVLVQVRVFADTSLDVGTAGPDVYKVWYVPLYIGV